MKKCIAFLLFIASLSSAFAADRSSSIKWHTNYQEAAQFAKTQGKPILLLFTGSDWCSYCIKLEEEALSTPEFAEMAKDKFIFVKLDFPINAKPPAELVAQNKELKRKFNISGYPTIVILDPEQQTKIGTAGYRAGGGRQYAIYLLKLIEDHGNYQKRVKNLSKGSLTGSDLKELYEHASLFGHQHDADRIAIAGLHTDYKNYFQLERYRQLAERGQIHSLEAQEVREQLLAEDPNNLKLTYYQVAVIDFEASCRESDKAPELIVEALVDYIKKFGDKDKDHLWRLQMIIAQVYFDKDKLTEALHYAQSAYKTAPVSARPEITSAIKNIQMQLH